LSAAEGRAAGGGAELLLVRGYAGVGKSALINEIVRVMAHGRGYFASGKFDQRRSDVPYSAISRALRDLIRQILTEPEASLARWRRDFASALGASGAAIVDLAPELELVIGPQPPLPPLPPAESQARFHLVFQRFLGALCAPDHPLALFLDDLQWADAASLKLLEALLTDPDRGHLLLFGAYRDNEVTGAHPLVTALGSLREAGVAIEEIEIGPLSPESVAALIGDTLGQAPDEVAALARVVHAKTHGNPFFVNQLLTSLAAEGLLRFDAAKGAWQWSLPAIVEHDVTDNVVDLMAARLRRLSPKTREIVELAACIGHRFDLRTLSVIAETPAAATAQALWPALTEGLIVPLDSEYRFVVH